MDKMKIQAAADMLMGISQPINVLLRKCYITLMKYELNKRAVQKIIWT